MLYRRRSEGRNTPLRRVRPPPRAPNIPHLKVFLKTRIGCSCFRDVLGGSRRIPGRSWANWISLFAYSRKRPACSGAFLLAIEFRSFFAYILSFFTYSWSFSAYNLGFFAYNGKVHLISALMDCKHRNSTVRRKTPTVSQSFPQETFGKAVSNCRCLKSWISERETCS